MNISGSLHMQPLVNQKSADHPKRASSASEERRNQLEGRASVNRSRQSESSERRELGMVREGVTHGSMPVFPKMHIAQSSDKKDTLHDPLSGSTSSPLHIIKDNMNVSSSTSLSATCSTGRGGAARADSLPNQLADHSRKSSIDSDISISDSRDCSQHQHMCSSASEISAMEERRRRRAALVRSRARNAPPTVSETPLDTETTAITTASDQISKDVDAKETNFEEKTSTTPHESGLQLGKDSNQSCKELLANSMVLSTSNVSGFAHKGEKVVPREEHTMLGPNFSEIKSPVAAEETKSANRSNKTDGRRADEATTVNLVNPEQQKTAIALQSTSSERMHKPHSVTIGPAPLGGSHVQRQTEQHKQQQKQQGKGNERKADDHLDSSISEEQPNAEVKSKEIVEDTVIVNMVQVKSVGQEQEQDEESANQKRASESLVAETVQPRDRNLKAGAAQLLATERIEFEVAETFGPSPSFHEQAFLSTALGEVLEHFTPTYQAVCFLVNRWITKPPHRLSTERVEYEVEECLCPPYQLQQQAFASAVDGRTFESLTSKLSGQGNILIHFVTSHLAPRSKKPKETKSCEICVNASSKDLTQSQQLAIASSTVSMISPAAPKVAAVIVQKKSTSAIKTPGKASATHSEVSASDQLKPKLLHQIASKEQKLQIQSSPATAVEKDSLECRPLTKKPLEHGKNEGKLTAPILPKFVSSKREVILPGAVYVKPPIGDVDSVNQSLLRAKVTESTQKCQAPVLSDISEKPAPKQEETIQMKDEDLVQVPKMPQQTTVRVIVPGWEKFKAVDALEKSDKSAVPNILPLVQQRLKQQEVAPTEKSVGAMASAKPQTNLLEEQKNKVQMAHLEDTVEQRVTREEPSDLIKKQNKEGQCSANIKLQAFKTSVAKSVELQEPQGPQQNLRSLQPATQQKSKVSNYYGTAFAGTAAKSATHQMEISTQSFDPKLPTTTSLVSSSLTAGAQILDCKLPSNTKTSVAKSVELQERQGLQQNLQSSQPATNTLQTSKQQAMAEKLSEVKLTASVSVTASDSVTSSATQDNQSKVKSSVVSVGPLNQNEVINRTETMKDDRLPLSHQVKCVSADDNSEQRGLQKDLNESKQVSSSSVKKSFSQETTRIETVPNVSSDLKSWKASSQTRSLDSVDPLQPETSSTPSAAVAPGEETQPTQPWSHRKPVLQKAKTFDVPESKPEEDDDDDEMFHLIIKRGRRLVWIENFQSLAALRETF